MGTNQSPETGLAVTGSGLPDLSKPSVAIKFADMWSQGKLDRLSPQQQGVFLAALGQHMGIKAELGDLMIYQGKPYITISGYRRIAHQSGLLAGISPRPASERDFRIYKADAKEHLWVCEVWKKGCGRPFTGWGHVRLKELEKGRKRDGSPFDPLTRTHPQEMARKRAIYDALRLAFPPSEIVGPLHLQYVAEAEAEVERRSAVGTAGDDGEGDVIDGELQEIPQDATNEGPGAEPPGDDPPAFQDDRDIEAMDTAGAANA